MRIADAAPISSRLRRLPEFDWLSLRVPLVVGLIQVVGTHFAARGQAGRTPADALGYALLIGEALALIPRKQYPVAALATITCLNLAYLLLGYPYGPVELSFVVAVFVAVTELHRLAAWFWSAALYFTHFGAQYIFNIESRPTPTEEVLVAGWLVVCLLGSEAVRERREHFVDVAKRRQEEARRKASEERVEMARELHDVLAHDISMISVQAGVALHLMDERPEQARIALSAIRDASKDALGELRSVLGALRQNGEGAPLAPAPGLARLPELVSAASAAGIRVEIETSGDTRELPAGVDLAAFRIVQEALTNVVRHAKATEAVIRVRYGEQALELTVDDNGVAPAGVATGDGTGSGLHGMQERATALGGEFEAGPRPGGGFRVFARVPLEDRP